MPFGELMDWKLYDCDPLTAYSVQCQLSRVTMSHVSGSVQIFQMLNRRMVTQQPPRLYGFLPNILHWVSTRPRLPFPGLYYSW